MRKTTWSVLALWGVVVAGASARDNLPKMKFNEVQEIAPGVYFRYSPAGEALVGGAGGSNNIWIDFADYVLVYDANFPKEAGDVVRAIRQTTDKPIRYVVDSSHRGNHCYGNTVFAKEGASVVAQANCARLLRSVGRDEFLQAGRGRKDVAASTFKVPDIIFDDKLVLDDGKQRVELLFYGHAHSAGDAFAYLPHHKVLCTGGACSNGPFNLMGQADLASWVRVLDRLQQLDVKIVCPGHGPLGGKDILQKQQRYLSELRQQVKKGIANGRDLAGIVKSIDLPWYKEWAGSEAGARIENIRHVYDELTGRIMPWDLVAEFGLYEGPSPTKVTPGWKKPALIVVPELTPARLANLKVIAPGVSFVAVKSAADAAREAADADAVLGFCTPEIVRAGTKLRWIQVAHAGVEKDLFPELIKSPIVLTNTQKMYGPNVADQGMALLLCVTRDLVRGLHADELANGKSSDPAQRWNWLKGTLKGDELHGKTMLVVGLGGIGTQIARRAAAFGMRVRAVDANDKIVRPDFVISVDPPANLMKHLPKADVVVIACPLTAQTRGLIGAAQFAAMKPTAYFINIARGGIVKTADLAAALQKKQIAGAGLDVTDPEPLPHDHILWQLPNVAISPHIGGVSSGARDRQWRLYRENVRRFVAGLPLLGVVDKERGY